KKVNSILYTTIIIYPDIIFIILILSQFLTNPGPEYLMAVNWIIKYLFGTRFLVIQYNIKYREI
ncbi:hypothetical protein NA56DRAFT_578687, partial [Hyaloscypha hepaticicola]